jgi:hypothetical protein
VGVLTAGCGASVSVGSGTATTSTASSPGGSSEPDPAAGLEKLLVPTTAMPGFTRETRYDTAHPQQGVPADVVRAGGAACVDLMNSFVGAKADGASASLYAGQQDSDSETSQSFTEWIGTFPPTTVASVMTKLASDVQNCHSMTVDLGEGASPISLTVRELLPDEMPAFGTSTFGIAMSSTGFGAVTVIGRFGDTIATYGITQQAQAAAEVFARELGPVVGKGLG